MILNKTIGYEDFAAPDKGGSASKCPARDNLKFIVKEGGVTIDKPHTATAMCGWYQSPSLDGAAPATTKPCCAQLQSSCVMAERFIGATVTEQIIMNGTQKQIVALHPFQLKITMP